MSSPQYLTGPTRNKIRALLRSLLKHGRLEARRTYYDYYDSCHAPSETPDAPFEPVNIADSHELARWTRELKAGGASLYLVETGLYRLSTGYSTYELRVIK